jgi:hypothetical protein
VYIRTDRFFVLDQMGDKVGNTQNGSKHIRRREKSE